MKRTSVITLSLEPTGWMATFSGELAETVIGAFGTDTIPTAFTAAKPAAEVQAYMASSWKQCTVVIAGGRA